jgi:hypothetical protein
VSLWLYQLDINYHRFNQPGSPPPVSLGGTGLSAYNVLGLYHAFGWTETTHFDDDGVRELRYLHLSPPYHLKQWASQVRGMKNVYC